MDNVIQVCGMCKMRNINLPQVQGSEVNHDCVCSWKQKKKSSCHLRLRVKQPWEDGYGGMGGWEGEKAAHPQAKEVTEAAEGDQQIVGLFRCCWPISHCLCRGGEKKLPVLQCFFTWSRQDKEEEQASLNTNPSLQITSNLHSV